jgi:hypothetical protein
VTSHGQILCSTHRLYGMECVELEALRARSAGCCEACGVLEEEAGLGRLIIDHDHRYGREAVRGLICSSCNSQLSVLENYHPYKELAADRRFETYLSRAWFAQVARFAKVAGRLPYPPDQDVRRLTDAALRANSLVRLQKVIQQHPELDIIRFGGPGDLRISVQATYRTATTSRYVVRATLPRAQGATFRFRDMSIERAGSPKETYTDLTAGLRSLRERLREDARVNTQGAAS